MTTTLLLVWAMLATLVAIVLAVWKFANPVPYIQIPDRGNRIFSVPKSDHKTVLEALYHFGLSTYGTFTIGGIKRSIMADGSTVIVSGDDRIQAAALSLPTSTPMETANNMAKFFRARDINVRGPFIPDAALGEKLVALHLPWGWDIAFRLPGKNMPRPKWDRHSFVD